MNRVVFVSLCLLSAGCTARRQPITISVGSDWKQTTDRLATAGYKVDYSPLQIGLPPPGSKMNYFTVRLDDHRGLLVISNHSDGRTIESLGLSRESTKGSRPLRWIKLPEIEFEEIPSPGGHIVSEEGETTTP